MSHLADIFFDFKVLARNNRQRLRFGHVIKFQVVKVKITLNYSDYFNYYSNYL